jgi:hypothetical protein
MKMTYGDLEHCRIEVEDEEHIYLVDPHRATRTQITDKDLRNLIYGGRQADRALREAGR